MSESTRPGRNHKEFMKVVSAEQPPNYQAFVFRGSAVHRGTRRSASGTGEPRPSEKRAEALSAAERSGVRDARTAERTIEL
jgi:hypothetical protein